MSEKEYSYRLSSFSFDLAVMACIPIAGWFLTYFAFTHDLDPVIRAFVGVFQLLTFLPLIFIYTKSKQKITILENGIKMKTAYKERFIEWQDVTLTRYDTIVSSFSRCTFSQPTDLVIQSRQGNIYIMDTIEGYDEIIQLLAEKITMPERW